MGTSLRAIDEQIALLRGWRQSTRRRGDPTKPEPCWRMPDDTSAVTNEEWAWWHGQGVTPTDWSPPYSPSWALAGPLLEEMAHAADDRAFLETWRLDTNSIAWACMSDVHVGDFGPGAISRAWLAWRTSQPGRTTLQSRPTATPQAPRVR